VGEAPWRFLAFFYFMGGNMAKKEASTEKKSPIVEEKLKALEAARLQIEKQFGKGSLMKLGESPAGVDVDVIPSGSILLDAALGVGGYPKGRVIEIYGPESSGKTTIALHAIAEAQKRGGIAAFVDAEHALDPTYAKNLGVNVDELWVSQPDTGEQALEIVESLIRSGAMDVIVVDSVAALTPRAEIEGDMGDAHVGLQARLMSQALRKLTATISKTKTCLVFINQIRMKIGVMFGNPETTTGGFRKAELDLIFGKGISASASLLEAAVQNSLVEKAGSWYSYGKERIGQGAENARLFLESNPAVYKEIDEKTRALLFPGKSAAKENPAVRAPSGEEPASKAVPRPQGLGTRVAVPEEEGAVDSGSPD
jgi:recombination protein RecA